MRYFLLLVFAASLSGCQCFRVCPTVPPPPENITAPELCYKVLRPADPVNIILECYIKDIVKLEGYSKQLNKALEAYK